jgi:hypothetical protein
MKKVISVACQQHAITLMRKLEDSPRTSPDQLRILRITKLTHHEFVVASFRDTPGSLRQPVRAGLAGLRSTSAPSSIVISTPRPASMPNCARTGLGMTTPWEFPIRRMLACIARIVTTM